MPIFARTSTESTGRLIELFTGSVARMIARNACNTHADRPALTFERSHTWTYRELGAVVNRYANSFQRLGVKKGDRIALLLHNSLEYWAVYLATVRLGAISVRLNWRLTEDELNYALVDSGASVLCVHDHLVTKVEPIISWTDVEHVITFSPNGNGNGIGGYLTQAFLDAGSDVDPDVPEPHDDDPCMIMYTSGTTGRPKGALWRHSHTLWVGALQIMKWHYDSNFRFLTTTPMFHVSGLEDWALPALMMGGHVCIMRSTGLSIERILDVAGHHKVTDVFLVSTLVYDLLSLDPNERALLNTSVRRIYTGGAPVERWALDKIAQAYPTVDLIQAYGLTEGGAIATAMDREAATDRPTSVGRPMPLVDVRVARAGDEDTDASPEEAGEIWVRGPAVCGEYFSNPEETANTFVNGWCKTGDLGHLDEAGYLYISGRVKDMIISGGENIYPAEIERVLSSHANVRESAVIGIEDGRLGEVPCAVVVARDSEAANSEDLIEFCRSHLARYKCPRKIFFVNELPRNAAGKVLKRSLREKYQHARV